MQFYLLVPLIFVALQIGFPNNPVGKLAIVSGISILVMCGFSLINANFAFNFMPLRLWQFGAGFVALFLREVITVDSVKKSKRSETVSTKWKIHESDVATCSAAVLFLCIFPAEGDALWLRPLITFTTALLIFIENKSCGVSSIRFFLLPICHIKVLKCSTLSYLGDISYVMYLVHWPVISLLKNSTVQSNVFCVGKTTNYIFLISSYMFFFSFDNSDVCDDPSFLREAIPKARAKIDIFLDSIADWLERLCSMEH